MEVLAEEKEQQLEIQGDPHMLINVDRPIVRQAIVNLLITRLSIPLRVLAFWFRLLLAPQARPLWKSRTRVPVFRPNINPTFSIDFIVLTKRGPENGVAPVSDCPSHDGLSRLMAGKSRGDQFVIEMSNAILTIIAGF